MPSVAESRLAQGVRSLVRSVRRLPHFSPGGPVLVTSSYEQRLSPRACNSPRIRQQHVVGRIAHLHALHRRS